MKIESAQELLAKEPVQPGDTLLVYPRDRQKLANQIRREEIWDAASATVEGGRFAARIATETGVVFARNARAFAATGVKRGREVLNEGIGYVWRETVFTAIRVAESLERDYVTSATPESIPLSAQAPRTRLRAL